MNPTAVTASMSAFRVNLGDANGDVNVGAVRLEIRSLLRVKRIRREGDSLAVHLRLGSTVTADMVVAILSGIDVAIGQESVTPL